MEELFTMKKASYEKPVLEIVNFEAEDVIRTSAIGGPDFVGTVPGFDWDHSWGTGEGWED